MVIGIIGILIGLLLPTIAGARRQARLVQCGSNLRTISGGLLMVAQERRGFLPLAGEIVAIYPMGLADYPAAIGDPQRRRYVYAASPGASTAVSIVPLPAAIAPYLGVRNLPFEDWTKLDRALNAKDGVWRRFMCPDTDALYKSTTTHSGDEIPDAQGTVMSVMVGSMQVSAWSTNSDYCLNEGVFGYHYDQRYSHNRLGGNISRIRRPSEVALYTDGIRRKVPAYDWMPDGWLCWTPRLDDSGPATLGDAWTSNGRVQGRDNFDLKRHAARMNVAYLDGHVQTVPLRKENLQKVYLIPP